MGPNSYHYDLEVWHRRTKEMMREADEVRLARRLRSVRPKSTSRTTAAAMGFFLVASLMVAALMLLGASGPAHASTTFTVNSVEDFGDLDPGNGSCFTGGLVAGAGGLEDECTLRAAIQEANATSGADTINFAIPGSGVKTITPASALPTITKPVSINGYSQPGAKPNQKALGSDAVLKIELSGASYPGGDGLVIGAANSTIKGLVINRWDQGIRITGSDATGNRVSGNYIGTDASGTQRLGNAGSGVLVSDAPNNTIGGTTAAARNVTSGNAYGIGIGGAANGTRVAGNYIGTDASGTKDLGNSEYGVAAEGGSKSVIGGATAGERNVISGNDQHGVIFAGNGIRVTGNYIGTDASGTKGLGNSGNGVQIVAGSNNIIGGATAEERNFISGNDGSGVVVVDGFGSATGNRMLQNSIFANGGLGIDLGDHGPTANDAGDGDTGANNLQNKPVLSSAKTSATSTTVRGNLNSTPDKTFVVRFFSNPSGTDEGKTFIGTKSVTTDASGNVTFIFSPAQKVGVGKTVTATATGLEGTSEFSAARTVVQQ